MVTALTSRGNKMLVYENFWLIKMNVCLTNWQYSPVFTLTGLLRPSTPFSLLPCRGKEKWQVWIVLQIRFVKPLPLGVCRRLSPSVATQWNKYALAPVFVGPQRFSYRSSRSRSLCKLLSVKKAQGKRKKKQRRMKLEGYWRGAVETLAQW